MSPFVERSLLVAAALALAAGLATHAHAHDGIASSDPVAGSSVDGSISVVTMDFGTPIGDDTELALIDPNDQELPSTTAITGPTTAEVTFEPLERQGTYFVRYLANAVDDGHLLVGAISFNYGSQPGPSLVPWVLFGVAAVVILAIGFVFSRRASRRNALDASITPGV